MHHHRHQVVMLAMVLV